MIRSIAALLLVLAAFTIAGAQSDDSPVRLPIGGGRSYIPFEVQQQDGKIAWKVTGRGTVKVEDVVGALSTALGRRISLTPEASGKMRNVVPFVAPEGGVVVANDELLDFANELLASGHLAVVGMTRGNGKLATLGEARSAALLVSAEEVGGMQQTEWATVTRTLIHADADVVRSAFNASISAPEMSFSARANQVVLTGPVAQVRKMLAVIDAVDAPGAGDYQEIVRSYTLPANVQPQQAVAALRELFDSPTTTVTDFEGKVRVTGKDSRRATIVPLGNNRILVRASASAQGLVADAVDAMK